RRASRCERAPDPGGQLLVADLALYPFADEPAVPSDEVGLGETGHAVLRQDVAGPVVHVRIRQLVPAHERARIAPEVLTVHALASAARPPPASGPPTCTDCTTTPRSSARPPSLEGTRATACRDCRDG